MREDPALHGFKRSSFLSAVCFQHSARAELDIVATNLLQFQLLAYRESFVQCGLNLFLCNTKL